MWSSTGLSTGFSGCATALAERSTLVAYSGVSGLTNEQVAGSNVSKCNKVLMVF